MPKEFGTWKIEEKARKGQAEDEIPKGGRRAKQDQTISPRELRREEDPNSDKQDQTTRHTAPDKSLAPICVSMMTNAQSA